MPQWQVPLDGEGRPIGYVEGDVLATTLAAAEFSYAGSWGIGDATPSTWSPMPGRTIGNKACAPWWPPSSCPLSACNDDGGARE